MAVLVAGDREVRTVDDDVRALGRGTGHVRGDLVAVRLGDERAHLGGRVVTGADGQRGGPLLDLLDQRVGGVADGHHDGDRHAALTGRTVRGVDRGVRGEVQVRVRQDQHVVLGAAEGLDALAVGRARGVDVAGDGGGADEGDGGDVRVLQDAVHRGLVAVDDVQHAVRQARLGGQLGQLQGRGRHLLAGLEDEGVPAGDGEREHPHRHHRREVERRDAGDDTEGLADRGHVHTGGDLGGQLALELLRDAAGQLDDLQAAGDLAQRVAVHLAVLGGDQRGQLLAVRVDQLAVGEQYGRTLGQRAGAPGAERLLGGGDGRVHLVHGGEGDLLLLGAGRGVVDRAERAGHALGGLSADPVVDGLHAGAFLGDGGERVPAVTGAVGEGR